MSLLESIGEPNDLRALTRPQLDELAAQIRRFLIRNVARTGGHLGPNLGVVELTLAIHRVFDSPDDPIIFDTGHQSYVHKILTGRQAGFAHLRQRDGLSGYPSRKESQHDWVENSHASAALSWGAGMAQAMRINHDLHTVVVVVGDGALTGGMAWEALNNIAVQEDMRIVIVVNDNGRSYTPTVGGLSHHLQSIRTDPRYDQTLDLIKRTVTGAPLVGKPAFDILHGVKAGLKDILAPQTMFADLGFKYLGPIDGHDVGALETALTQAKNYARPVIVHAMTVKGKGFAAAEHNEEDHFHAVGQIDSCTGKSLVKDERKTWTDVFAEEIVSIAQKNPKIVAFTAAMLHPVGLTQFSAKFPNRLFDVGIAEQHAVTCAAGMAMAGMHPVFAVYSTFLNRAFDQMLMDVALHQLPVTIVLDRGGITGPDGASHNGMWDYSMLGIIPGIRMAMPRDEVTLRAALQDATCFEQGPTVVRYGKGAVPEQLPAVAQYDCLDILWQSPKHAGDLNRLGFAGNTKRMLVVACGAMAQPVVDAAQMLLDEPVCITVVDPKWVLPIPTALTQLAQEFDEVITVADALIPGGIGDRLAQELRAQKCFIPVHNLGITQEFLAADSRSHILAKLGLDAKSLSETFLEYAKNHSTKALAK